MGTLERFLAYAADFEKTLADDDWSRLEPYFHEDAVYAIDSDLYGCELSGRDAVFAGLKKSLDGMDRKFTSRDVETTGPPEVDGDAMEVGWKVLYHRDDTPDFVLPGRSRVELRDGRIAKLVDSFEAQAFEDMKAWVAETGVALDPSYV